MHPRLSEQAKLSLNTGRSDMPKIRIIEELLFVSDTRDNHNKSCQQFISSKKGLSCALLATAFSLFSLRTETFGIYLVLNGKTFRPLDEAMFQLCG